MVKAVALLMLLILKANAFPLWFQEYTAAHRKSYTPEEADAAFRVLEPKHDHIQSHSGGLSLRLHHFSDRPRATRRLNTDRASPTTVQKKNLALPLTFDWRTHGAVTDVQEQGTCGGCYCFAGMGSLEYWWKKKTGRLERLSVQECISCTKSRIQDSEGCEGGLMEDLYELAKTYPIGRESFDPFKMRTGRCPARAPKPALRVKSYVSMSDEWGSPIEQELAHHLIAHGPIPVGISSQSMNFELYKGGILRGSHCSGEIDHAVTVVGFGIEGDTRYWIVKNSWGTRWGVDGYFYLERDKKACGINSYASFVTAVEYISL